MLSQRTIVGMCIVILVGMIMPAWAVDVTWYVSWDDGNDVCDCNCWANACKTIGRGLDRCTDANNDTIDVNDGNYVTPPLIIDHNNIRIVFQQDVNVIAKSIDFDSNNPDDPNDETTFRDPNARLFKAIDKSNLVFDGYDMNDTILQMRRDEYPRDFTFDTADDVNLDSNQITLPDHNLRTGDYLFYEKKEKTNTALGGLSFKTYYNVIVVGGNNDKIQLADSFKHATADPPVAMNITTKPSPSEEHYLLGSGYRHVIGLYSCSNVDINDLTLRNSSGDGICVGDAHIEDPSKQNYCDSILIERVDCNNNYRCGIGVISANDLLIQDCILQNTNGELPQPEVGIDFECNKTYEMLKNVRLRRTTISKSDRNGIAINVSRLVSASNEVGIMIEDVNISGSSTQSIYIRGSGLLDDAPDGSIAFKDVSVVGGYNGLRIIDKSPDTFDLSFENCTWQGTNGPAIYLYPFYRSTIGGVDFIDCEVNDDDDLPAIRFGGGSSDTLQDIHGDIYVDNDNRTDELYDWNGATLSNVDIILHSDDDATCQAHNVTDDTTYTTNHVCFTSINSAIDDTDTGTSDQIKVYPGTHYESVDFDGKAITIKSKDPDDASIVAATIIDANGANYGVYFHNSETSSSQLRGLTVTGASRNGIYCTGADPNIENCVIENNGGTSYDGGGMKNYDCSPTVKNCVFAGNSGDDGGGMYNEDASPTVVNCLFYNNDSDDDGAGMYNYDYSDPDIINCTFFDNDASDDGGGICNMEDSDPALDNCIFWGNDASSGEEIYNDTGDPTFSYCCIRGGLNGDYCDGDDSTNGGGNISSDPQFCDTSNVDGTDDCWATCDDGLSLQSDSPCVDTGTGCPGGTDLCGKTRCLNSTVDMGAYEMDPSDNCGT